MLQLPATPATQSTPHFRRNSRVIPRSRKLCVSAARPDVDSTVQPRFGKIIKKLNKERQQSEPREDTQQSRQSGELNKERQQSEVSEDAQQSRQHGELCMQGSSHHAICMSLKRCDNAGVLEAKRALQFATAGTFRGGLVTPTQRAVVEEAIVRLLLRVTASAWHQDLTWLLASFADRP